MSSENTKTPEENLSGSESIKVSIYFWLQALVLALVSLILIFTLVGRIIGVDGNSMLPTLHDRDLILLRSIGYTPKQGDIVVLTKEFASVTQPIVKRVIAVGGQTVKVDQEAGRVYVDGVQLNEPYLGEPMYDTGDPYKTNLELTVPEGSIYVMGDNRNHSSDSRDIRLGTVDERYVLGHALFILFPFGDIGSIE